MSVLNAKYMRHPRSGMIVKDLITLAPGHAYYRFAHSMVSGQRQNRDQIVSGAWWLDADVFNTIRHKANATDSHLSSVARRDLAVARRWGGKVDIVVRAILREPLLAYVGIGTIQVFDSATDDDMRVWYPAAGAIQLFVPGLRERSPQSGAPIYRDAFERVEQTRIGWDPNV